MLPEVSAPVFIQGLPGLGGVGRIVADVLIEQLGAELVATLPVEERPGAVLVTEEGLVRFPELRLYRFRQEREFLLLAGEGQPEDAYAFAERLAGELAARDCAEIVTVGGIGLRETAQPPKVYVTGNRKGLVRRFAKLGADPGIHGVVGPIIGLTGIMLGLAKGPAVALLAESIAHPLHLSVGGAEQVLRLLAEAYGFTLDLSHLEAPPAPAGDPPQDSYIG